MNSCFKIYRKMAAADMVRNTYGYPASVLNLSNDRIIIEIGPGRGDFLFHLAETKRDTSVVGIEIKRKRVDKLILRTEKRNLNNVVLIQDDARHALPNFFKDLSVDEIHINFPDPWPKKRHAKNRAVSKEFLSECRRILKSGGLLSVTTDHESYAKEIALAFGVTEGLVPTDEKSDAFPTFFAIKWQKEGRKIFYQRYIKDTI